MKNFIIFALIACLATVGFLYFNDKNDKSNKNIENIKTDILSSSDMTEKLKDDLLSDESSIKEISDDNVVEEVITKKQHIVTIEAITEEQFVSVNDINQEDMNNKKVDIVGKILNNNIDKITIDHNNSGPYTLKKYKKGDTTFLYRAYDQYNSIVDGVNVYIVEAFIGDKSSKLKLTIDIVNKTIEVKEQAIEVKEQNIILSNITLEDLPVGDTFGVPTQTTEGDFVYSKLDGVNIEKKGLQSFDCDSVTSTLSDIESIGWFYWNTCRPIKKDKGISYFVLRLSDDKFIYEKHSYIFENNMYITQLLEEGEGINSGNIQEKNVEFKLKNEEFKILNKSDDLVNAIIK